MNIQHLRQIIREEITRTLTKEMSHAALIRKKLRDYQYSLHNRDERYLSPGSVEHFITGYQFMENIAMQPTPELDDKTIKQLEAYTQAGWSPFNSVPTDPWGKALYLATANLDDAAYEYDVNDIKYWVNGVVKRFQTL